SIAACSAQMGSISVTVIIDPAPLKEAAVPLPTSPYPATTTLLPANMVSVALRMASTALSRQPYLLSNLDLVTESLTLMAGIGKVPFFTLSYNRCTPVVVSSDRPLMPAAISGYLSNTILVRSPPSSKIIFNGLRSSPKNKVCSMHQSNSCSFIPCHAYTGIPAAAIAAAAWSWVEKMLQELQVTSAPNATKVSIRTAVCMVMCRHPAIRAPFNGCSDPYSLRRA